jgi:hypothetical protein
MLAVRLQVSRGPGKFGGDDESVVWRLCERSERSERSMETTEPRCFASKVVSCCGRFCGITSGTRQWELDKWEGHGISSSEQQLVLRMD